MSDKNLKEILNPSLSIQKDNKPSWYLPKNRREGYKNLHKINRYGFLLRSDLVFELDKNYNSEIENISSVKLTVSILPSSFSISSSSSS